MAIDELLDEHEQGERVREWLRSKGGALIGGVVLGLLLIAGWQWWQKHQLQQQMANADSYQTAMTTLASGGVDKAKPLVSGLANTGYHTLAALALAKAQVDADKRADAIATLRAARADAGALDAVVVERLARLLVDAGKPQEAIALLADASTPAMLEARGDAEFAAGRKDQARSSYRKALAGVEEGSPARRLLELKLSEVGGAGPDVSAKDASAKSALNQNKPDQAEAKS